MGSKPHIIGVKVTMIYRHMISALGKKSSVSQRGRPCVLSHQHAPSSRTFTLPNQFLMNPVALGVLVRNDTMILRAAVAPRIQTLDTFRGVSPVNDDANMKYGFCGCIFLGRH